MTTPKPSLREAAELAYIVLASLDRQALNPGTSHLVAVTTEAWRDSISPIVPRLRAALAESESPALPDPYPSSNLDDPDYDPRPHAGHGPFTSRGLCSHPSHDPAPQPDPSVSGDAADVRPEVVQWFHDSEEQCDHDYDPTVCELSADALLRAFTVEPRIYEKNGVFGFESQHFARLHRAAIRSDSREGLDPPALDVDSPYPCPDCGAGWGVDHKPPCPLARR